jgi:hypothetical protein
MGEAQKGGRRALNDVKLASAIRAEIDRQDVVEKAIEAVVDGLVAQASKELDDFVKTIKNYLDEIKVNSQKGKIAEYDERVLEMQIIKLPVLMYFAADQMEDWGLFSDVAKAEWQDAYDKASLKAKEQGGRVADMELAGRHGAQIQDWAQKVKGRVYSKLKTRLKYADEIFNGLRKIMGKRISELEVFRREQASRLGRDYDPEGEQDE